MPIIKGIINDKKSPKWFALSKVASLVDSVVSQFYRTGGVTDLPFTWLSWHGWRLQTIALIKLH